MKALCPICNVEGHLQIRGKSARIGHYRGYNGKTRFVEWHKIDIAYLDLMVINGKQSMVNKIPEIKPISKKPLVVVDRGGFEPPASALRRRRSYQTDLPARLAVSSGIEPQLDK